jgi:outer membrane protein TolC
VAIEATNTADGRAAIAPWTALDSAGLDSAGTAAAIAAESVVLAATTTEPIAAEPIAAEPIAAELAEIEAVKVEPTAVASTEAEAVETASVESESVEAESTHTESVETGPVEPESVETGSIEAGSVETEAPEAVADPVAIAPDLASESESAAVAAEIGPDTLEGDAFDAADQPEPVDAEPAIAQIEEDDLFEAVPPIDEPVAEPVDAPVTDPVTDPSNDAAPDTAEPLPAPPASMDEVPRPSVDAAAAANLDLQTLEADPNPLQFPTLPEEVRILITQPITLEQALEIARRNNRSLQESRLTLERAQAGLRQALAANYPTLQLNAGLVRALAARTRLGVLIQNRNLRRQGLHNAQSDPIDSTSLNFDANLELSYNIYTSGLRPANIDAAQAQIRDAELAIEQTYEQLKLDVSDAYYLVQQENAQLLIDQSAVQFREQSVRDAQALEDAGLGTRFEVLQAQVELANDRQRVVQTRDRLVRNQRDLARLLSLPEVIDVQTADPIAKAGDWALPLEESIVMAYKNRAELERQLVARDLNAAEERARLAQLGPQLSISARYELADTLDPDDDFGIVDGYTVAMQLRWLLFDGGSARAQADQENIDQRIAESRFAQTMDSVRFDVERFYSSLKANEENIGTSLEAIAQANEEVRLARLRFQAGVGTQTDVLNAESRLTRARGNVLIAVINYNRSLISLERAVTNLPPGVVRVPENPLILPDRLQFAPGDTTTIAPPVSDP